MAFSPIQLVHRLTKPSPLSSTTPTDGDRERERFDAEGQGAETWWWDMGSKTMTGQ